MGWKRKVQELSRPDTMSDSEDEDSPSELDTIMGVLDAFTCTSAAGRPKKPVRKKVKGKKKQLKAAVCRTNLLPDDMFEYDWPPCACGRSHPPVPHFAPPDGKLCTYYWQIADVFPFITLHRVLSTEIKFLQADADQSGVIEENELCNILKETMRGQDLTDNMIQKTFAEIDTDNSGTIDFVEVLTAVNTTVQRGETKLPKKVEENYSKVCTIQ